MTVPSGDLLSIRLVDQILGLPDELDVPPLPNNLMPTNYGIDFNSTYVSRSFSF